MPKVSVIIATYKDDERLRKCISALDCQTYPKDNFEVIIVNNDAENDIPNDFKHSLNLKILTEYTPGSYIARNLGIKHAEGKILAFTDSDAIPEDDWIETGVNTLLENHRKTIIAGNVKLFFENDRNLSLAECYEKYFAFPHQRSGSRILSGMVAGNVFIFSSTISEIGSFNSKLLSGGDTEFSKRALQNGYIIKYNPDCIVYHPSKYLLSDLLKKRRRIFGGKVFRNIHIENQTKKYSLIYTLKHQMKRYLNELRMVFKIHLDNPISQRIKLSVTIFLIIGSLLYESAAILIANRTRRR